MSITKHASAPPRWLVLIFGLPAKRASQRVSVWRQLQRFGAVPLGKSGYFLPNDPTNHERFERVSTVIRKHGGKAWVFAVQEQDSSSSDYLTQQFVEARSRDYRELIRDFGRPLSRPSGGSKTGEIKRLRTRFQEVAAIDFFHSPLRERIEVMLKRAEGESSMSATAGIPSVDRRAYKGRLWVTRPRPGIDRSASAWLIRRYIDSKARFGFAQEANAPAGAVPFDMFHGGFGHRGEDCTFETLKKVFRTRNRRVDVIAQIVHDADLGDEKFGRKEGFGIDEVLKGWASENISDKELLARGMQMVEGLYRSLA
jgi:hypothetical protein